MPETPLNIQIDQPLDSEMKEEVTTPKEQIKEQKDIEQSIDQEMIPHQAEKPIV